MYFINTEKIDSQIIHTFNADIIKLEYKDDGLSDYFLNKTEVIRDQNIVFKVSKNSIRIEEHYNNERILIDFIKSTSYSNGIIIFTFLSIKNTYYHIHYYNNEIIKIVYEDNYGKITYYKQINRA